MAMTQLPAPDGPCANRLFPGCTGTYLLYTEGALAGLLECIDCGYTPNGANYTETDR